MGGLAISTPQIGHFNSKKPNGIHPDNNRLSPTNQESGEPKGSACQAQSNWAPHFQQFRSRVRAITERFLNPADVGSAERLARTPARQPVTDGTGAGNQPTIRLDKLPDTSRNTDNNSRLLLPSRTKTTTRVRRRPGPSQDRTDAERRRDQNITTKERVQDSRTELRQLLRQEERSTLQRNPKQPGKGIEVMGQASARRM